MRRMPSRLLSLCRAFNARETRSASAFDRPARIMAACDFGRRAYAGFGVQGIAAEQIDFLQLREQSRAGVAAGGALHLGDRQEFIRVEVLGEELLAVEMAGDDQNVAADALPAGRSEPVRPAALHQLDELIFVLGEIAPERLLFVGRIDGDRADGALWRRAPEENARGRPPMRAERATFLAIGMPYAPTSHAATTRADVAEASR